MPPLLLMLFLSTTLLSPRLSRLMLCQLWADSTAIKLVFRWGTLNQIGFVHRKSAPFDPQTLEPAKWDPDEPSCWDSFQGDYNQVHSSDEKWGVIKKCLIQSLVNKGAKWGAGPQQRGTEPVFVPKRIAPRQHLNNCAATKCSAARAYWGLRTHEAPITWQNPVSPDLVEVYWARRWAESAASMLDTQLKLQRIKRWKERIKQSAQGDCRFIFHHLRNRDQDEPPNLVLDEQSNVL